MSVNSKYLLQIMYVWLQVFKPKVLGINTMKHIIAMIHNARTQIWYQKLGMVWQYHYTFYQIEIA